MSLSEHERSPRVFVFLALALALGTWLRIADLGNHDLTNDGTIQLYAALGINESRPYQLPSGREYTRGSDITQLVALSLRTFPDTPPEVAARLPSATFGVISLLLMAFITWRMVGAWVAFWAVLLLAIYPEAVFQSRHVRFYSYQLCYGLIAIYTGWLTIKFSLQSNDIRQPSYRHSLLMAGATLALVLLATFRIQPSTLSLAAGWIAALFTFSVSTWNRGGTAALKTSPIFHLLVLGAVAGLLIVAAFPQTILEFWDRSQWQANWAVSAPDIRGHYWQLITAFPVLISLLPLLIVVAIVRKPAVGIYLLLLFAVPLLLHTFLFVMKEERYLLLAMPPLFILAGQGLDAGARYLYSSVPRIWPIRFGERLVAGAAVILAALWFLVTSPSFNESRKLATGPKPHDWRTLAQVLSNDNVQGSPVGTTAPLRLLFYAGQVDFVAQETRLLEYEADSKEIVAVKQEGDRDDAVGKPLLTTADAIRDRFGNSPVVYLVIPREHWEGSQVNARLAQTLREQAEELCKGRCGGIRLYRWPIH